MRTNSTRVVDMAELVIQEPAIGRGHYGSVYKVPPPLFECPRVVKLSFYLPSPSTPRVSVVAQIIDFFFLFPHPVSFASIRSRRRGAGRRLR